MACADLRGRKSAHSHSHLAGICTIKASTDVPYGDVGPRKLHRLLTPKSADTLTGLPWAVDVNEKDLSATGIEIDTKNKAKAGKECFPTTTNLNFSTLTLTPNSTKNFETVTVAGEGIAETNVGNLSIVAEGSLEVTGASKGTYGIEKIEPGTIILDEGKEIQNDQLINFSGNNVKFEALGSGIECVVHATITANENVTRVTKFEITTSTCIFFGNPFKNCKFEATEGDTVTNLPWTIDPQTSGGIDVLTLTGGAEGKEGRVDNKLESIAGKTCFTTQNDVRLSHEGVFGVTLEVTTVGGFITGAVAGGNIRVVNSLGESTAGARGTFTIEAGKEKTYTFS